MSEPWNSWDDDDEDGHEPERCSCQCGCMRLAPTFSQVCGMCGECCFQKPDDADDGRDEPRPGTTRQVPQAVAHPPATNAPGPENK